jgi:hypothetical protein
MLLDAAHDAEAIYKLLKNYDTEPFIDLNPRTKNNYSTNSDIKISPEGIPICPKGLKMKSNGFDKSQDRIKWRCPLACGTKTLVKVLVLKLNMAVIFIPLIKIIYVCLLKHHAYLRNVIIPIKGEPL